MPNNNNTNVPIKQEQQKQDIKQEQKEQNNIGQEQRVKKEEEEEKKDHIKQEDVAMDVEQSNDNNNNQRQWEFLYWTDNGELRLPCVDGCDGTLDNDKYGQLAETVYAVEGLPKKMECKGPDCDTILSKRALCFYCPYGVIKGSNHIGMVWCRFCAYKKALKIHKMRISRLGMPREHAAFDKSVVIYGFGSIEGLQQ